MTSDSKNHHFKTALSYANGYRELEMFDHALLELDGLSKALKSRRSYAQMRLAILMDAQRWKEALPFANRLASVETNDPSHLINLAYVTRRADSMDGAQAILESAIRRFPDEAVLHYNLGCYACHRENLDQAKEYLRRAFRLDPSYLKISREDSDLHALSEWIDEFDLPDDESS